MRRRPIIHAAALLALALLTPTHALAQRAPSDGPMTAPDMPDGLLRAISAEYLTDEERREMRVRHGLWTEEDLEHPTSRARAALIAGVYDDPVFGNDAVDPVLRAEAAVHRGAYEEALGLLAGGSSLRAARLRARALEGLGRFEEANRAIDPVVSNLMRRTQEDADALVEGVRALIIRARLEGTPAEDYRRMLDLLARAHQDLDRFNWRAMITEAELLFDKDAPSEAQKAAIRALSMNPALARGWKLVGRSAVNSFDVDRVERVADRLDALERRLDPSADRAHVMSDVLRARVRLRQRDPDGAMAYLERAHRRYPLHRETLALRAAGEATRFEYAIAEELLESFDELSPESPLALFEVGAALAESRQYVEAEGYLERAIDRQPNWPGPLVELGLLHMQTGEDEKAEAVLDRATTLDPFNKRAGNSMELLRTLLEFDEIGSEHFIVRHKPGVDGVIAMEMLSVLESLHETVSTVFEHVPERRTVIELMPDHTLFAVRITGMTGIHTIAAATGPLIAMETPRDGRDHSGPYDWARVVQHEYAHTVTLSLTNNRIPHWFTEAAAVYVEPGPRAYRQCELLLRALETDTLFDMNEINIAFVRPEKPTDRAQAYAQGHWMYEYIVHEWGPDAPLEMMELYASGFTEIEAMNDVLGVTVEAFQKGFVEWARADAASWGMLPSPSLDEIRLDATMRDPESREKSAEELADIATSFARRSSGRAGRLVSTVDLVPVNDARVDEWLKDHPDHPDLLELSIEAALRRNDGKPGTAMIPMLERYAAARPVDPMPHKHLASLYLDGDDPSRAIPHLEYLDAREQYKPVYAAELARRYADEKRWDEAMDKATRAVRIAPYDGNYRELAATIAIRRGDLDEAEHHVETLTQLEPTIPQHDKRLEAIRAMRSRRGN